MSQQGRSSFGRLPHENHGAAEQGRSTRDLLTLMSLTTLSPLAATATATQHRPTDAHGTDPGRHRDRTPDSTGGANLAGDHRRPDQRKRDDHSVPQLWTSP